MTIQEVSVKTGLSSHTLRYYEKIGLITPVNRNSSGHRNYNKKDLDIIEFIKKLKLTGMPIKEISRLTALLSKNEESYSERLEILEKHRLSIENRLKTTQDFLNYLKSKIEWYKKRVV